MKVTPNIPHKAGLLIAKVSGSLKEAQLEETSKSTCWYLHFAAGPRESVHLVYLTIEILSRRKWDLSGFEMSASETRFNVHLCWEMEPIWMLTIQVSSLQDRMVLILWLFLKVNSDLRILWLFLDGSLYV